MNIEEFVDKIIQLDETDRIDLAECIIALNESDTLEETQACRKTIIEIVQNDLGVDLVDFEELKHDLPQKLVKWSKAVGNAIKTKRESDEWTQHKLALASGIPESFIIRLESGIVSPSNKVLNKIADSLGVDPTTFYPPYD